MPKPHQKRKPRSTKFGSMKITITDGKVTEMDLRGKAADDFMRRLAHDQGLPYKGEKPPPKDPKGSSS